MSYLHCHTKNCGWAQDDFYSKSYNPLTKIWSDIKWLYKPKMVEFDWGFVKYDVPYLTKYTGINIKFKEKEKVIIQNSRIQQVDATKNPVTHVMIYTCFSWKWLLLEIAKDLRLAVEMKWWTYKSFKKDLSKGKAKCPKCGLNNFDID